MVVLKSQRALDTHHFSSPHASDSWLTNAEDMRRIVADGFSGRMRLRSSCSKLGGGAQYQPREDVWIF